MVILLHLQDILSAVPSSEVCRLGKLNWEGDSIFPRLSTTMREPEETGVEVAEDNPSGFRTGGPRGGRGVSRKCSAKCGKSAEHNQKMRARVNMESAWPSTVGAVKALGSGR